MALTPVNHFNNVSEQYCGEISTLIHSMTDRDSYIGVGLINFCQRCLLRNRDMQLFSCKNLFFYGSKTAQKLSRFTLESDFALSPNGFAQKGGVFERMKIFLSVHLTTLLTLLLTTTGLIYLLTLISTPPHKNFMINYLRFTTPVVLLKLKQFHTKTLRNLGLVTR